LNDIFSIFNLSLVILAVRATRRKVRRMANEK
jgi:hypothetical protein